MIYKTKAVIGIIPLTLREEDKDWDESRVIYPSPCINLFTLHKKKYNKQPEKLIPRKTIC